MARSRTPKFDASGVITNEIIRIIERGVLPWRKPWTAGGSCRRLCCTNQLMDVAPQSPDGLNPRLQ